MSLFILVAQLDADSNRAGHHILRYVCPERLDYAAEVLPTALTALNIDSFVQGLNEARYGLQILAKLGSVLLLYRERL
jgi:hypothetical protein